MTGDAAVYVWGSYIMGVALIAMELLLLRLRDGSIRGHLGWTRGYPGSRTDRAGAVDAPAGNANA